MRSMFLALGLAAAIAAGVSAQSIDGPDQVQLREPAWYTIAKVPGNCVAVWMPTPELQAGPPHIVAGHALFYATTPGKRTLTAIVAVTDAGGRLLQLIPLTKQVEVTGEAPPDPFRQSVPNPRGRLETGRRADPPEPAAAGLRARSIEPVQPIRPVCPTGQCPYR